MVGIALAAGAGTKNPDVKSVRTATARFHSVTQAEAAGYGAFLECFGSEDGGMGQHYVNKDLLDGSVDATTSEAMVYEVKGDKLVLVGVEYIAPMDKTTRPSLFGRDFHANDTLGVWVLHAWVWRDNPVDMFADWNPDVAPCPEPPAAAPSADRPPARSTERAGGI